MFDPRRPGGRRLPASGKQVVRKARLDQELAEHDAEIGMKMAMVIHKYHQEHVEPRLSKLEWYATPFYRKIWIHLQQFGAWLWSWVPRLRRLREGEQTTVPTEAVEPAPPSIRDAEGRLVTPESDQVRE